MTLEEAIMKGSTYLKDPCPVMPQHIRDAFKLGIEALEAWMKHRGKGSLIDRLLLPSETEH